MFRTALGLWRTRIGLAIVAVVVGIAIVGPGWRRTARPSSSARRTAQRRRHPVRDRRPRSGRVVAVPARWPHDPRPRRRLDVDRARRRRVVGLVAAYNRGRLDNVLMRCVDIILAFPGCCCCSSPSPRSGRNTWVIVLLVALTVIPRVARVTRGTALGVVERDFVGAAEALGESRMRILGSEVLPNIAGPLLVEASLRLTYSIFLIGALGFLGLGIGLNRRRLGADDQREPPRPGPATVGDAAADLRHRPADGRRRPRRRRARAGRRRHRSGASRMRRAARSTRLRIEVVASGHDIVDEVALRSAPARCSASSASRGRARRPSGSRCSATRARAPASRAGGSGSAPLDARPEPSNCAAAAAGWSATCPRTRARR